MRFRLLAGPNGSGKSTVKAGMEPFLFRNFVNADEIERHLKLTGIYKAQYLSSLPAFNLSTKGLPGREVFDDLVENAGLVINGTSITASKPAEINSYIAATLSDFLRYQLAQGKADFCSETVLSHPSKVDFLRHTKDLGYRNYFYFVATIDPSINVTRVKNRVLEGGHNVPEDKIRDRYFRSIALAKQCLPFCYRAYFFDNSDRQAKLIAQVGPEREVIIEDGVEELPDWFFTIFPH